MITNIYLSKVEDLDPQTVEDFEAAGLAEALQEEEEAEEVAEAALEEGKGS